MKKLILFFIIILNITSYSMDITAMTSSGKLLEEVLVKINHQVKITDNNGNVTFDINDEILNISLSKEGYEEEILTLKNNENDIQNLTLIMKPLKTSFVTFEFSTSEGIVKYREVGAKLYTELPFLGSSKTLNLPFGTYEFIFSSKNYQSNSQILNLKNISEHYFIDLDINKNKFFLIGNASKYKTIKFYDKNIGRINPIHGIDLVIFKDGHIVRKVELQNGFIPIELEDGVYDFMIENNSEDNTFFRGIEINDKTSKNIVISVPDILTTVKGVIKNNGQFIGGAKLVFTDVNNNSYETTTTFVGEFSIDLPPQKYKIRLNKPGFIIQESQNLIYDFTVPEKKYTLTLDTEELLSSIEGVTLDNNGEPLPNVNVMIKNGENIINLKSDDFGVFSGSILPGLLFIKAEKDGYKSFGLVTKLERFSSLSGLQVSLKPYLSNISGTVGSSFSPKENIQLALRNESGEIIANAISNENGYYEFPDININHKYFISVGEQSYKYYYSKPFILGKKDLTNQNIILESRDIRLYIEFIRPAKIPISKKEILINGESYQTDTNGFVLLDLPEDSSFLEVEIESYGFHKTINLKNISKNPNLLTIVVK